MTEITGGGEGQQRDVRPSMAELKERVARGENPHTVIRGVVEHDGSVLYSYVSGSGQELGRDALELYGLVPDGVDSVDAITLPRDLDFVAGFNYVISHWYGQVERASKSEQQPADIENNPLVAKMLGNLGADEAANLKNLLATEDAFAGIGRGVVREALAEDPSGVTWLNGQLAQDPDMHGSELEGARRAIRGIGTLYKELQTPPQAQ